MLPYGRILRTLQYIYLVWKWVGYWLFDYSFVNISIWATFGRPPLGISCKNIFALISSRQVFLQNSWEVEMNCKNIFALISSRQFSLQNSWEVEMNCKYIWVDIFSIIILLISLYGISIWATFGRPPIRFPAKYICVDILSTILFAK